MKKLVFIFVSALFYSVSIVAQDDSVLEYVHLFPNCVDNQESTIYGGTYGEYTHEI